MYLQLIKIFKVLLDVKLFIDGTFKTCPDPYEQFVISHGLYHGRVLPFVLALVTGKTVGHYRQILQHVKARVRNLTGHRFAPNMAITDFEHSLRIAIDTELRRTRVRSCYFHFCQNLWRHVQSLGLARSYTRYRNLKLCIQKVMAIAYLPVAIVRQNFRLLLAARRTRRLINRFPALRDFLTYFQRNYLDGQFHIPEWNVYERNVETRTNNHVEGLHIVMLNTISNGRKPSVLFSHFDSRATFTWYFKVKNTFDHVLTRRMNC